MTECARARRAAFAFAMAVTAGLGVDFAWAVDPPPRPSLTVGSSSVQADLESWCRPVGERFGEPSLPGRERPYTRADDARHERFGGRVTIALLRPTGSRPLRTVRPLPLDERRWRFRMPSQTLIARVSIRYRDGGTARAVVVLRPRAGRGAPCGAGPRCPEV